MEKQLFSCDHFCIYGSWDKENREDEAYYLEITQPFNVILPFEHWDQLEGFLMDFRSILLNS